MTKMKLFATGNCFFTGDEHYGHANIIRYCNRPSSTVDSMDDSLIAKHNAIVKDGDVVFHAGDFTMKDERAAKTYIHRLNGQHFFIRGSHDKWLPYEASDMIELEVNGKMIVICHYAMRVWARSHYGSWQVYGHSHGRLEPVGKQWDVGVDNNDYYPVSFEQLSAIMETRPDNFNYVGGRK